MYLLLRFNASNVAISTTDFRDALNSGKIRIPIHLLISPIRTYFSRRNLSRVRRRGKFRPSGEIRCFPRGKPSFSTEN